MCGSVLCRLKYEDFMVTANLTTARISFDLLRRKILYALILRNYDRVIEAKVMGIFKLLGIEECLIAAPRRHIKFGPIMRFTA